MSKENQKTLEVYEQTAKTYIANTIRHDELDPAKAKRKREKLHSLIRESFGGFPKGAKIFEVGSAEGTNAKFIESLGFEVTASDVAEDFVEETQKTGLRTIKFNALEDSFPEKYDGIFAWRVFVHFTEDDAREVISKVYEALNDGGIFVFNAINREVKKVDNEWVDFPWEYHMGIDRYYNYFRQEVLDEIIQTCGFKIRRFFKDGGESGKKWLVYVIEK